MHCHKIQSTLEATSERRSLFYYDISCEIPFPKFIERKMSMKEKRLHTDHDEVKREMQKVADELGLLLNSCRVAMNGHNVAIVRTNVFQT